MDSVFGSFSFLSLFAHSLLPFPSSHRRLALFASVSASLVTQRNQFSLLVPPLFFQREGQGGHSTRPLTTFKQNLSSHGLTYRKKCRKWARIRMLHRPCAFSGQIPSSHHSVIRSRSYLVHPILSSATGGRYVR